VLQDLQADGLLTVGRGKLTGLDPAELRNRADAF